VAVVVGHVVVVVGSSTAICRVDQEASTMGPCHSPPAWRIFFKAFREVPVGLGRSGALRWPQRCVGDHGKQVPCALF
jgi:hypothetical protein